MPSDSEQSIFRGAHMSSRRRANSVQAYEISDQPTSRIGQNPTSGRINTSDNILHGLFSTHSNLPPRPMRHPARHNVAEASQSSLVKLPTPREEITPWEFHDPPPSPIASSALPLPPPPPPPVDDHAPSSSRSRLPSPGSSFSSFVRRRKSTGGKPLHQRPILRGPSPSPASRTRSAPAADAANPPHSTHTPPGIPIPPPSTHPSFAAVAAAYSPPQSTASTHAHDYNTADRTILEELKRNIEARRSQFTLKGPGVKKERHHPFSKECVPYPRNYSRLAVDLDIWETLFCQQLCNSPTWHVFERPPTKVLDIGCGTGSWVLDSARVWRGCHFVGLDIVPLQPDLLQVGSTDIASRITWVHTNFLEGLPFPENEFDYVHIKRIALGVPEDKWDGLFEEVSRVLKPDGALELFEEDLFFPGTVSDGSDSELEGDDDDDWSLSSAIHSSPSHPEHIGITSEISSLSTDLGGVAEDDETEVVSEQDRFEIINNAIPKDYRPSDLSLPYGFLHPKRQETAPPAPSISSHSSHSPPTHPTPELQVFKTTSPPRHDNPSRRFRIPRRPATSPSSHGSSELSTSPSSSADGRFGNRYNDAAIALLTSSGGASIAFGGIAAVSSNPLPPLVLSSRKSIPGKKPSMPSITTGSHTHDSHNAGPLSAPLGPKTKTIEDAPRRVHPAPIIEDSRMFSPTTARLPGFQRRPRASSFKAPINPRNHALLKFIYDEMNAARFVNLTPLSLITNVLNIHFKNVRINPPLTCTFPPKTITPPKPHEITDVDKEAQDAIIPDLRLRRESAATPLSTQNTNSHSKGQPPDLSEDGRWVSLRGAAMGVSPYVQFDLEGSNLPSREPLRNALDPKQLLPNMDFRWDLRTLNLHLAVRVVEVLSCVESMWEHVLSVQEEYKDKPLHFSPPPNLVYSGPAHNFTSARCKAKKRERIAALVDMTREDFDILVRNFELDMRESMNLDSAIRDRLGWPNKDTDPAAEREAFIAANELWREYEAQRSRRSKGSRESHESRSSGGLTKKSGGRERSSSSAGGSILPPKDDLRPSRALKVFIAWNAS